MSPDRTDRILIASMVALLCLAASAAVAQDVHDRVNVKDYVDKSGNKTDQTEAIRQAIAASSQTRSWALYFPPGAYNISDTIDISGVGLIVGENARIGQTNPEKDIFYSRGSWRKTVRGLGFYGGRDQIALGNGHTDQGFFVISECSFNGANGAALRLYREGELDMGSSFALVEKCAFVDCDQSLIAMSDGTVLRDCWISTKEKKNNRAVIENYNTLLCQNILGVPRVTYTDQRWIDNYGNLTCRNFRFGGEGSGFTPVVNFTKTGGVKLEDCCYYALGNNKRACAVYLEEIPNALVIKDSSGSVPPVKISPKIDLQADLNGRQGRLVFDVPDDNRDTSSGALPKELSAAMAHRKVNAMDYGTKQLSAKETKQALAAAVATAKSIPSAKEPGVMTLGLPKGQEGHRQVIDPAKYVEINPQTNAWDLNDKLDGGAELTSVYLAMASAGDDVVVMSRMDGGSYPHMRIHNVTVDLDKTPWLTWRLKNNGTKGGHQAMKVINNATEAMTTLMEDYYSDQFGYYAYDLRQALGVAHGTVNVDLKFYMCNDRITSPQTVVSLKKGDYFLIDFVRLEAEQ